MFFQLYHKLSEKGTLMTQNLCLKETNFTSDIKLPLLQEKKKKCTMLEETQVVSGDRNSDKASSKQQGEHGLFWGSTIVYSHL